MPPGHDCRPKTACFLKIYLLSEFLSYRDMTYLFGNHRTRAKKTKEPNLNFGVGTEILRSDWVLSKFLIQALPESPESLGHPPNWVV
jgi:hypothetical protein